MLRLFGKNAHLVINSLPYLADFNWFHDSTRQPKTSINKFFIVFVQLVCINS